MAIYRVKMPTGHLGTYQVKMPTGHLSSYRAYLNTGQTTEDITINMGSAPPGASWTLRNSASTVVDTGTADKTAAHPFDVSPGYTLEWEDTAFEWYPPGAPDGPEPLYQAHPIIFDGPP